nr:hypothetical protein GCM10010200_035640 [Actinomadura rugatobispora]
MSQVMWMGAVASIGATLALASAGTAHAVESSAAPAICGINRVAVYQKKNFGGQHACIAGNIKKLADFRWPDGAKINDSISSIQVPARCWVTLYRYKNYKGDRSIWRRTGNSGPLREDRDLSNNRVGDNRTSSLKSGCTFDA